MTMLLWDSTLTAHISINSSRLSEAYIEGILPKGPYLPCVSMAGRALLAGYPPYISRHWAIIGTDNGFSPTMSVINQYIYQWLCARLLYIQCICTGDTTALHQATDICMINPSDLKSSYCCGALTSTTALHEAIIYASSWWTDPNDFKSGHPTSSKSTTGWNQQTRCDISAFYGISHRQWPTNYTNADSLYMCHCNKTNNSPWFLVHND